MNSNEQARVSQVWGEYESGRRFKSGLGENGMYEQNRRNERFFVGDQWHGAKCGGERPLVRHNVIKRIGDYKMAVIGASPVAVDYSAEGVPHMTDAGEEAARLRENLREAQRRGAFPVPPVREEGECGSTEIDMVMNALLPLVNIC